MRLKSSRPEKEQDAMKMTCRARELDQRFEKGTEVKTCNLSGD